MKIETITVTDAYNSKLWEHGELTYYGEPVLEIKRLHLLEQRPFFSLSVALGTGARHDLLPISGDAPLTYRYTPAEETIRRQRDGDASIDLAALQAIAGDTPIHLTWDGKSTLSINITADNLSGKAALGSGQTIEAALKVAVATLQKGK